MPKAKPILHTQIEDSNGQLFGEKDEMELSDEQLDWLAEFFAPIIQKSLQAKGT
jgi:hypothetical protein